MPGWMAKRFGSDRGELDATEPPEMARAGYAIDLASTFRLWVHRRVETFEFPNADTVRRRMSVDFTLPADPSIKAGDRVDVPLMILKREFLRNFDVMDEEGTRLKVLTTREHDEHVVAGLFKFLNSLWPDGEQLMRLLKDFAGVDDSSAGPEKRQLRAKEARSVLEKQLDGESGKQAFNALRNLMGDLERGFLLLVPLEYQPNTRRLVKFSYDAVLYPSNLKRWQDAYRRLTRAGASLGWFPQRENFEDIQVGWAESYHVEVVPPTDTRVAEAALHVDEKPTRRDNTHRLLRPHLLAQGCASNDAAELTLLMHPQQDALILPLLFAAVVIAAVLTLVPGHRASLDGQTLGALLLVPLALSAFYVRPGEHSYVTKSIQGLRMIAAVPVLCGVLVLTLVALGLLDDTGNCDRGLALAQWAARASVGAAYLLLIAFVVPAMGKWARVAIHWVQGKVVRWKQGLQVLASLVLAAIFVVPLGVIGWWVYSLLPF